MKLLEMRNITWNKKQNKTPLDMLNIILDSAEKTVNQLEAKSKEMTQYVARSNELLEDTNTKRYGGKYEDQKY